MDNKTLRKRDSLAPRGQISFRLPRPVNFHKQLNLLRWLIPVGLMLLVIIYEIGPSRWTYEAFGFSYHLLIEILIFGTIGPLLAFVILELLGRWIDEKDTADLQAQLLTQASEKELEVRKLNDETLQVLFATNLFITNLKTEKTDLPLNIASQIDVTEQALNEVMQNIRSSLMD